MRTGVKIAILFAFIFSFGCKKKDPTPVPPVISFMEAGLSSDKSYSIVKFEFYDGDGDLGLKQEENTGEQEYNVFVDYYELNNGVWELKSPILDSTFNFDTSTWEYQTQFFHQRMPFIENEGELALEGDIEIALFYDFRLIQTTKADTFRYEISIKDRALQSSNVITTSDIVLN
jgi:hypothetical protein